MIHTFHARPRVKERSNHQKNSQAQRIFNKNNFHTNYMAMKKGKKKAVKKVAKKAAKKSSKKRA